MGDLAEALPIALSTFSLIALAEFGDKSQLVCMTLAMRHRHLPVMLGATAAFVLLNTVAVLFGAAVADRVPERAIAVLAAILFAVFGVLALRSARDQATVETVVLSNQSLFLATVLLVFVAEFGDKTQLAVAALAGTLQPVPVWVGATAALIAVSALGVWAGRTVLQRMPLTLVHRLAGAAFLVFALAAAWHALPEGWQSQALAALALAV
jgi:Ca2+/H+ antiporter, TMEM165/GDT1 family